jgi:pimeloyl-ACP methyl ester carboxylesterase
MKPTIVLVHGAWMDATAWYRVIPELEKQGYAVIAVNLPGHGDDPTPYGQIQLSTYVDAVTNAIGNRNVILVGHSMAGIIISAVAEQIPSQIIRLVYVAAYLPQDGESLYQLSQQDKDSQVGRYWRQDDPAQYSPASIAAEGIAAVFAADAPQADKDRLIAQHKADALAPMATPVSLRNERFGSVKKVYVYTTEDQAVSYYLQRLMTSRTRVDQSFTLTSSHSPFFSQPLALIDCIIQD